MCLLKEKMRGVRYGSADLMRRNIEDSESDLRRDLEAGMDKMEASSSAVNLQERRAQW